MKRLPLYIIMCAMASGVALKAQSVQQGVTLFSQFETERNAGNEASAYNKLWQSYQELSSAAGNVQIGSDDYNTLRNALRIMHPWMERGFIYNATHGQRNNSSLYAQAYLDIQLMPCMTGVVLEHTDNYPTISYNASATTYNSGDYQRVIPYFKIYLSTGDTKHRRDVLQFMMDACTKSKDYESARSIMDELVSNNTGNSNVLTQAINVCMELHDYTSMQRYLSMALSRRPNDTELLKLQGQAYEETQQYEKAIDVYTKLKAQNPRSLDASKHLAVCNYNLGVLYYNEAAKGNNTKKNQKQSKEYFSNAATVLTNVVSAETSSLKYHQALAVAYMQTGQNDKLAAVNQKVAMLGGVTVTSDMEPVAITTSNAATDNLASISQGTVPSTPSASTPAAPAPATTEVPLYSAYAKQYVEGHLKQWQQKDAYETADEYRARVNEVTRNAKVKDLLAQAEQQYVATYTANIRFNNSLKLRPYDAENRVFLVESDYGELIIPVPRENNEARSFEQNWSGIQFTNPQFYVNNDRLMLSALTFVTPSGKAYQYTGDKSLNYTETEVDVRFDNLDSNLFASNNSAPTTTKREKQKVSVGLSDVDTDLPVAKHQAENTFAVIICNEDYNIVSPVPMAKNDGEVFAQYCEKTFGLPKNNVRLYKNASYGVMIRAMRDIASIASVYQGNLDVIFYYAGHGIPDESTKDAYLLPIDADGTQTEGCYSLNKLYGELGDLKARSVVVFLDACFSGAKRDGGMLASARGVALKAKQTDPKGNMVIFSAASGDETAMPYSEKNHGLFTYFLLKKLKESKGNVTLSDLGDYIGSNVRKQATVVNRKPQTPTVIPSTSMVDTWQDMKLINK